MDGTKASLEKGWVYGDSEIEGQRPAGSETGAEEQSKLVIEGHVVLSESAENLIHEPQSWASKWQVDAVAQ